MCLQTEQMSLRVKYNLPTVGQNDIDGHGQDTPILSVWRTSLHRIEAPITISRTHLIPSVGAS